MRRGLIGFIICLFPAYLMAQEKGVLSGDFSANVNLYDYDSAINTNTTQYLHELSSVESWLYLNYRYSGFNFTVRYDLYHNSPLLNPQEAYTKQGIGFYSISKSFKDFTITGGYFYDQFGSGMIFRAYEERTLGLDYALQGVRLEYHPNDSFKIKAFTGQQKNRFDIRPPIIKGVDVEKMWGVGKFGFQTGAGFINRTLDRPTMALLAETVNNLPIEQRKEMVPMQNVYAGTIYNTLTYSRFSLYLEYAAKTMEDIFIIDSANNQVLKNLCGKAFYGSASYSIGGLGLNLQYKKTDAMIMRTSPYTTLLEGVMNFMPALSKQHSFRLPARYSISAQPQGEEGIQAEVTYTLNKKNSFDANFSKIMRPDGVLLFNEYYLDWNAKFTKQLKADFGIQNLYYNQEIYEGHPGVEPVKSITPFMEWTYRFSKTIPTGKDKKSILIPSLRTELQYLKTDQDLGDFAFALLEVNLAPKYSMAVSDMVNTKPKTAEKVIHYYNIFASYTVKQTRLTLAYVKQVQGVVCTGGVCRVEPAFSGMRFTFTTNF